MDKKKEKILLVTGASSEIGSKLVTSIIENYDYVITHYFSTKNKIEELQQNYGGKIQPIQSDFSDAESVAEFVSWLDKLEKVPDHIVHLSAAPVDVKKFHRFEWSDYQREVEIAMMAIVEILRICLPKMAKQKYGKLVFMLTSHTLYLPAKYQAPYVSAKYALLGLMKSLSVEYANKGITVNGVSPDMIETKFLKYVPSLVIEKNAKTSPLGRNLVVEDIVSTFEYLLSDASNAITGQNIGVTGGTIVGG